MRLTPRIKPHFSIFDKTYPREHRSGRYSVVHICAKIRCTEVGLKHSRSQLCSVLAALSGNRYSENSKLRVRSEAPQLVRKSWRRVSVNSNSDFGVSRLIPMQVGKANHQSATRSSGASKRRIETLQESHR